MANDVQRPVFAAASGSQQQGDDFDLNEIFADYFNNEQYEDPINAYTASMANNYSTLTSPALTSNGMPSMSANQAHQQAMAGAEALPTGGIKTAFHTATVAPPVAHYQHGLPSTTTPSPAIAAPAPAPVAKRIKMELEAANANNRPLVPGGVRPGGLTSRLGVPMPLAQAQVHAHNGQMGVPAPAPLSAGQGISLPVGVGIRLGGAGGVAPATAQNAGRVNIGAPGLSMWAGGPPGMGGVGMSDQAVAERRQRNREHAKRSRVRKKFMLESLQEQVHQLQLENQRLRTLVQDNIPEHAQKIISECCQSSTLFADANEGGNDETNADGSKSAKAGPANKPETLVRSDFQLMASLSSGQQNFVLSDPRLPDNPIVFATPGFYKLTGYTQEQVLGRNCRFLQGPGTNPKTVDIIRKAIATGADCTVCILNYKADGSPFWNQFFVAALRDSDNCIVNYVGVQTEVEPDYGANALEDRVNAVLPLQAKDDEDEDGEGNSDGENNNNSGSNDERRKDGMMS